MYKRKIIFDSDGLIKLIKAKLPKKVFVSFNAYITEKVYGECVIEGKNGLYEESYEIESLVKDKKIVMKKIKSNLESLKILKDHNFGEGEESVVHLYFNAKVNAIISDDKKFLNFLLNNNIPFMIPTDFIVSLYKNKILNKKDSLKVLEGLKPFVKDKNYFQTKNKLEDGK